MPKGERSSGMLLALSQNFRFLLTWRCVDCLRAFGDVYRAKVGYETDVRDPQPIDFIGASKGNRTPVFAVRGRIIQFVAVHGRSLMYLYLHVNVTIVFIGIQP
jgi:hypothetical protein